jgi:hypothetical protein
LRLKFIAMKWFYLLPFCMGLSVFSHAQSLTQTIRGWVSDKISERALPGATVSIEGT